MPINSKTATKVIYCQSFALAMVAMYSDTIKLSLLSDSYFIS